MGYPLHTLRLPQSHLHPNAKNLEELMAATFSD